MKALEFCQANWKLIAGLLYAALNLANAVVKGPEAKSVVGKLIDALAFLTRKDADGTLKIPLARSKAGSNAKMKLPALLPLLPLVLLASCACWQPEHRNDKGCAILHSVIDCTKDALTKQLGRTVSSIIAGFLAGNVSVDWDMLLTRLEEAGIKDGGCILAQIQNDLLSKPAASPTDGERAKIVAGALARWKVKHGLDGVKYRVVGANGEKLL